MGNSGSRFVWYELATSDVESAKAFYAGVVGWGTAEMPGSVYTQFTAGDAPVAGLMKLTPNARRAGALPQWIGFVGVEDVDVAAGRVQRLGGTVLVPPANVPNITQFSVIADPQGAPLALVKTPERDRERPVQPGAPGRVGWHELLATDWERAFTFYGDLFGWQKGNADVNSMGTYQEFSAGAEAIGGMWTSASLSAAWLYYLNVSDIVTAAKRVEASGGRITYGPVAVPGGSRVAHCIDPEGAVFGLIHWRVQVAVACYAPRDASNRPPTRQPGKGGKSGRLP